jgi:hypothetical protein
MICTRFSRYTSRSDGRRGIGHATVGAGLADRGQARSDRQVAGDEGGASGGAARETPLGGTPDLRP